MQLESFFACRHDTGATLPFGKVYVYLNATTTLASLFNAGGGGIANPAIADSNGLVSFAAADGIYDLVFQSADGVYSSPTLPKFQIFDLANASAAAAMVISRTALAALATPSDGSARYLAERGREGWFTFSSANLSALVTADTAQGVYVAPAAAPTGASGAWVRTFMFGVSVKWFGAKGDGTTNDGAAFDAANAFLYAIAIDTGSPWYKGSPDLLMPCGHYYLGTHTQEYRHGMIMTGEGSSMDPVGYGSTLLRWDNGVVGIITQFVNTTGVAGYDGAVTRRAPGAIYLRNFSMEGGFVNTCDTVSKGLVVRSLTLCDDLLIRKFSDTGVYTHCSVSPGIGGNGSGCRFNAVKVEACRIGFYTAGSDVNVIKFTHSVAYQCMQAGFVDENGAGANVYDTCEVEFNGWLGQNLTTPIVTHVSYSGKHYVVKYGQETWCAANAPSGTTDHNTGWIYAGTDPGGLVAWSNGMANLAYGGDWVILPNCWNCLILNCYQEGGGYAQALNNGRTLLIGGTTGLPNAFFGGQRLIASYDGLSLYSDGAGVPTLNLKDEVQGAVSFASPTTGMFAQVYALINQGLFLFAPTSGVIFRNGPTAGPWTEAGRIDDNGFGLIKGALGYRTGIGGAVTQATNKTTGVTLNKSSGQVTMNNAALAASAVATFTLTNSQIAATDIVNVLIASGAATPGTYRAWAEGTASGSVKINVQNISGGSLSEALVLNFAVIKAVAA